MLYCPDCRLDTGFGGSQPLAMDNAGFSFTHRGELYRCPSCLRERVVRQGLVGPSQVDEVVKNLPQTVVSEPSGRNHGKAVKNLAVIGGAALLLAMLTSK